MIAGIAILLVIYGVRGASAPTEAAANPEATTNLATPVGLMELRLQDRTLVERQFLGRIEAAQSADIGFEIGGKVAKTNLREGAIVSRGDVLARLTTDTLLAEREALVARLEAAQVQFEFARAEYDRIANLVAIGATPGSRLNQIETDRDTLSARLLEAESAVEQLDTRLQKSTLLALFDGIIGAADVAIGETVLAGQSIASVFERGRTFLRVGLPTTLDLDELWTPAVNVGDQVHSVRLEAVRPDIDFRTNTRVAIFEVLTSEPISFG